METLVARHGNFLWIVAVVANHLFPDYLEEEHRDLWRCQVFHGVTALVSEQGCNFWDIRWDCVRLYALNRMSRILVGRE